MNPKLKDFVATVALIVAMAAASWAVTMLFVCVRFYIKHHPH